MPSSGAGAYVRIKVLAKGELDPKAAQNSVIAGDKAPVNAAWSNMRPVLHPRPADPHKGSGILFTRS